MTKERNGKGEARRKRERKGKGEAGGEREVMKE